MVNSATSKTRGPLGDVSFYRLRESVVTLVGAGRNGTLAAFQLASLGVGCIRLLDADKLQPHNYDDNPGVPIAACGLPKINALASALRMFRPDMTVQVIEQQATYRTLESYLCERSDLVVTCVDSDTARLGVALVARRNLLVHLDVATGIQRLSDGGLSMTGDASLLLPTEGCCSCAKTRVTKVKMDVNLRVTWPGKCWHFRTRNHHWDSNDHFCRTCL